MQYMADRNDDTRENSIEDNSGDRRETTPVRNTDISDPLRDRERLQPERVTIDIPDVRDIPGQEHVHTAPPGELADTTISSDDEEGLGIFEDDEEDETFIKVG